MEKRTRKPRQVNPADMVNTRKIMAHLLVHGNQSEIPTSAAAVSWALRTAVDVLEGCNSETEMRKAV